MPPYFHPPTHPTPPHPTPPHPTPPHPIALLTTTHTSFHALPPSTLVPAPTGWLWCGSSLLPCHALRPPPPNQPTSLLTSPCPPSLLTRSVLPPPPRPLLLCAPTGWLRDGPSLLPCHALPRPPPSPYFTAPVTLSLRFTYVFCPSCIPPGACPYRVAVAWAVPSSMSRAVRTV